MKKFKFLSVLLGTLIVICICGCGKNTADYIEAEESLETDVEELVLEQDTEHETKVEEPSVKTSFVYVYICGAVQNAGVYALPEGSRVCDVFELAGGLTNDAAVNYWNQAQVLSDGEMIYVPTQEEAKERNFTANMDKMSSQNIDNSNPNKVNINTASKEQLMTIPGIGEAKANAIIAYRQANGGFSSVEDVKKIEGIKDGVYAKMKEYIVIN